jgi:hypothetical protein
MKLALAFSAFAVFLSQAEAFAPVSSSTTTSTSTISTSTTWNNLRAQTSLKVAQDVEVNSGPITSNLPRKKTKEVSYFISALSKCTSLVHIFPITTYSSKLTNQSYSLIFCNFIE